MSFLSPITLRRFRAFRRNRRAWWSLIALGALSVFSMAAELVCPCSPHEVVDAASLEPYRRTIRREIHEVLAARCSLAPDGSIFDWEGPAALRARLEAEGFDAAMEGYRMTVKEREGYRRIFFSPLAPPRVVRVEEELEKVAWPFRPVPGHPFGIDSTGRDVYARTVHGLRVSLLFGFALAFWAVAGGFAIGAVQGYFGGAVDILGQRLTEIWSAMPFLYVMIFIGSAVGRSMAVLMISYSLFNWITVSGYVRAEFLRLRSRPFVDAARCMGYSPARIMFREVAPNALMPVVTLFPFALMGAIGSLAALDFLGFGLPPLMPSIGELLAQASSFRTAWWLALFPSAALFLVMLLTVLVGEGLRDAFDPRRASEIAA